LGYKNRPDRNSLGSKAATGIPSRSPLLPLRTPSPGGVAHRPTSLTQSSAAQSQHFHGKTQTRLSKRFTCPRIISRDDFRSRLHAQASSIFPNNPRFFHSSLTQGMRVQGMCSLDCKEQTQTLCFGQVFHGFFSGKTQLTASEMNQDIQQRSYPFHAQGFGSEWRREPILGSVQGFYLHAPGLTLVTLGTACIPSVHFPPTTWELTGPSKGLRIK
jgi:hypothetical protein